MHIIDCKRFLTKYSELKFFKTLLFESFFCLFTFRRKREILCILSDSVFKKKTGLRNGLAKIGRKFYRGLRQTQLLSPANRTIGQIMKK